MKSVTGVMLIINSEYPFHVLNPSPRPRTSDTPLPGAPWGEGQG
jgi:hypothetical protein